MTRNLAAVLICTIALPLASGCAERALKEASGAALGAEAKVVAPPAKPDEPSLAAYKTFQIDVITVGPDLSAPADLADVVKAKWTTALTEGEVTATDSPSAIVKAEIVHYEGASLVDAATGPFTQIIVRATIIDVATQKPIRSANLVGRATSIAAGTPDALALGSSKALLQWLGDNGVPVKNSTGTLTRMASNPTAALASGATSVAGALPGASAITGASSGTGALSGAMAGAAIPTAIPGAGASSASSIPAPSMAAGSPAGSTPALPNAAMPDGAALPAGGIPGQPGMPGAVSAASIPNTAMPNAPALPINGVPGATAVPGNFSAAAIPGQQQGMNLPQGVTLPNQPAAAGALTANGLPNASAMPGTIPQNPTAFTGNVPSGKINPAVPNASELPIGSVPGASSIPGNITAASIPGQPAGMNLPEGMTLPNQPAVAGALPNSAPPNTESISGVIPGTFSQNPAALAGSIPTVPIDSTPIPGAPAAANVLPNSVNGATIPTTPSIAGIANQAAPAAALPGTVEQVLPESIAPHAQTLGTALCSAPIPAPVSNTAKLASDPTVLVESLPAIPKPPAIPAVPQPPAPPPIQEVPVNN